MIVVDARIETSPETIAALRDTLITMQQASQAEDGCDDYTFSVELANPGVVRITERWTSREALAAHFATPHMATFQAALRGHPPRGVKAHFYDATEIDAPR
jgi:quinol monooxygenase YgiN